MSVFRRPERSANAQTEVLIHNRKIPKSLMVLAVQAQLDNYFLRLETAAACS
jgi:hypothetical protein